MWSEQPERRPPSPSLLEVPAHLLSELSPRRRRLALISFALLAAGVAVLAVTVVPAQRAARDLRAASAARRDAQARDALLARLDRQAQARTGAGPAGQGLAPVRLVEQRRRLVTALEAAVLADARLRAKRGELRGTYGSVTCFEFPKRLGAPPIERQVKRGAMRLECIAVASTVPADKRSTGSLIGQPFRAQVDFARGRFAWCQIVQRPGELSIQQALLRVPDACGG